MVWAGLGWACRVVEFWEDRGGGKEGRKVLDGGGERERVGEKIYERAKAMQWDIRIGIGIL